ncbi:MAG: DUF4129 domain-containing protein, partial [Anaerolineales bacterium]
SETPSLELAQRPGITIRIDVQVLVGSALLGLVAAWLTWVMVLDPLRLRRRPPGEALLALYQRLRRHAQHLGIDFAPGNTPYELQAAIAQSPIGQIEKRACSLIDAYVSAAYARGPVDRALSSHQIRAWRRLSSRLWLERVKRTLKASLKLPTFH